jgi:membrane protein required for colicin V production
MNGLDVAVIAVILLSGLFAFARGFVREALSVVAWVGAGFAALYAHPFVTPLAARFLPGGPVAEAAAAIGVFLVALLTLSILTSFVSARVKDSSLSAVDRTLGLMFGLLRGAVLVCLAYIALGWLWPADKQQKQPSWIEEARTKRYLESGADQLRALVPSQYREKAETRLNDTRRAAEQMKEAAGAMRALSQPHLPPGASRAANPLYSTEDQRDLNRLIQQQQKDPE